jgi:hypothetical protein
MCHRMHRLDGNGHDAPPVVTSPTASSPHTVSGDSVALIPDKNRVVYPGPLNVGLLYHTGTIDTYLLGWQEDWLKAC